MAHDPLTEQLLWLLEQARTYTKSRDTGALRTLAVQALLTLTGAERAFLFIPDDSGTRLTTEAGVDAAGNPATHNNRVFSVAMQVLKDRRPVLATDSAATSTPAPQSELRLKQLICLPLACDSDVLGIVYADGKANPKVEVQSRALELWADQMGAALDNARVFERANNDLLTGLPNNSAFLFQLGKALRSATAEAAGGVLLLDVDDFKRVNHAAGAEMGDRALVDIAHTLREVVRADGLVARYGSDKFAVLLPPDAATKVALRLHDVAERARAAVGTKSYHGVQLSCCLGGIAFGAVPAKAPEVIALADNALARARGRGPGQVEIVHTAR